MFRMEGDVASLETVRTVGVNQIKPFGRIVDMLQLW